MVTRDQVGGVLTASAVEVPRCATSRTVHRAGLADSDVAARQARWGAQRGGVAPGPAAAGALASAAVAVAGAAAGRRAASYFVGQRTDAVIIGVIVAVSVGLGFVNEYRAEKAAEALHSQIHHDTVVVRADGQPCGRRDRPGARRRGRPASSATSSRPTSGC